MKKKFNIKIFLIVFSIMILSIFFMKLGNDYFWHTKVGEYIVTNLSIPYHDVFSWYGAGKNLYWMSHEWLSEVFIYGFDYLFKSFGPIFFCFITYSILIVTLYCCNKENFSKNKLFTIFWSLLGFLTFSKVILPRPHMISYILLAFTIYILLDNFNNKNSKKIYFLPLISLLWSNFHGGSSNLPYILGLLFLVVGLFDFKFGKIEAKRIAKGQMKNYLIAIIFSFLVIIINPHGIKMITYPYINMADKLMLTSIVEWFPPNLNNLSDFSGFLLFGIVILIMIWTKDKVKLIDLIVLGAFLILGFKGLRFIPLLYIVSTFFVFNMIKEYKINLNRSFLSILIGMCLVVGLLLLPGMIDKYNHKPIPDKIIEYLKEERPKKLFNFYNYGGYLIYKEIPVFIDGRADMYSKYNLKDYMDMQNYPRKYLLDSYDFDVFIIPRDIPLSTYLGEYSKYKIILDIEDVLLYEKIKIE